MKPPPRIPIAPICKISCFNQEKVAVVKTRLAEENLALTQLAGLHKLLGNAMRLKILLALAQGELCVCDIAHVLGLSVAATSHQLKLLRDQGWLRMRNDGKMVYYRLHSQGLLAALAEGLRLFRERLA